MMLATIGLNPHRFWAASPLYFFGAIVWLFVLSAPAASGRAIPLWRSASSSPRCSPSPSSCIESLSPATLLRHRADHCGRGDPVARSSGDRHDEPARSSVVRGSRRHLDPHRPVALRLLQNRAATPLQLPSLVRTAAGKQETFGEPGYKRCSASVDGNFCPIATDVVSMVETARSEGRGDGAGAPLHRPNSPALRCQSSWAVSTVLTSSPWRSIWPRPTKPRLLPSAMGHGQLSFCRQQPTSRPCSVSPAYRNGVLDVLEQPTPARAEPGGQPRT